MKIIDIDTIIAKAKKLNIANIAYVKTQEITFSHTFREMCEQNYCGNYGKNHMCPPEIGNIVTLQNQVQSFSEGVVFQTIHTLEDSYDFDGMTDAAIIHNQVIDNFLNYFKNELKISDLLILGVGVCTHCEKCSILSNMPCAFPQFARSSLEAYCIDVQNLLKKYGIPYINGENTVSYVGLILFK